MAKRRASRGQVLILFVLFLLVLLGFGALAIDYAGWLLTDRALQNVADHGALAGASAFEERNAQGNCAGGQSQTCSDARAQAWASLSSELELNLTVTTVNCLSQADSPVAGETDSSRVAPGVCTSEQPVAFGGHTIWVSTPPPDDGSYTNYGGRYVSNFGIVWVRVDRPVRSFLGGVFGITPNDRTGWATAGSVPTDFALQVFCRNRIQPQNADCENGAGLTIDGGGAAIRVLRGDIASNQSVRITSPNNVGVIIESGNLYRVAEDCGSYWECPVSPATTGGIVTDDPTEIPNTATMMDALFMAPLTVPRFGTPVGNSTNPLGSEAEDHQDCAGASVDHLCVPNRPYGPNQPGVWMCDNGVFNNLCGSVVVPASGQVRCEANVPDPDNHLDPTVGGSGFSDVNGTPTRDNGDEYLNIDDDYLTGTDAAGTTAQPGTPADPPADWVWSDDLNHSGPGTTTRSKVYVVNLKTPGGTPVNDNGTTVRFVAFKTDNGALLASDPLGYPISLTVVLLRSGAPVPGASLTISSLPLDPTQYSFSTGQLVGANGDYNNLSLRFSFTSTNQLNVDANERGGGISWAEAETPTVNPVTALPPMIPPGYYHSIRVLGTGACAILDPTSVYGEASENTRLMAYQMPGIYRFVGEQTGRLEIDAGGALIGDGVTLVFDSGWGKSGGLVIGDDAVLALNTSRVPGLPVCTPTEPSDTTTYNPSGPLVGLASSAICAAWGVRVDSTSVFRAGIAAWPYCDPADVNNAQCVDRSEYSPVADYRGVTFYFTPNAWPATEVEKRFQMGGGGGVGPGLAFRGVLYAPYDDVKMSGGCNGFDTAGQVLAWTAKFNGGCGYIKLDYPYPTTVQGPFLLEPTVGQ